MGDRIKKYLITHIFEMLFKISNDHSKTKQEMFNIIFDKLKNNGYYHNFGESIS